MLSHMKELLEHYFTTAVSVKRSHAVKPELDRKRKISVSVLPGCCPQRCDPSLEDSHEELEGIFSNYYKIYGWKKDAAMDDESNDHSQHVHPKLPCNHLQVSDGDDLSTDKAGNTKRRVPDGGHGGLL